jgi:inosine-uridine nucleoside N-ribohydrolase
MSRQPMILDCDPGHDDVVAILLAARHADLLAVTTVAGNAPLEKTTKNALIAVELFGAGVPVYPGAVRPLLAQSRHAVDIHGESGLEGPELFEPAATPGEGSATERILELTRNTDGVWIVATGPLTNIALALRADPSLSDRIQGISIMGGGLVFGNVTPAAEFNLWVDPEAAAMVFRSGIPLSVCPLDVTHQVLVGPSFIERVRSLNTRASRFMGDLFEAFADRYARVYFDEALGPLHDPCAVLAVTHPELLTFEAMAIDIGVGEGPARGMTIVDRRKVKDRSPANARVGVGINNDAVFDLIFEAIQSIDANG